jgi:hypothetical protein
MAEVVRTVGSPHLFLSANTGAAFEKAWSRHINCPIGDDTNDQADFSTVNSLVESSSAIIGGSNFYIQDSVTLTKPFIGQGTSSIINVSDTKQVLLHFPGDFRKVLVNTPSRSNAVATVQMECIEGTDPYIHMTGLLDGLVVKNTAVDDTGTGIKLYAYCSVNGHANFISLSNFGAISIRSFAKDFWVYSGEAGAGATEGYINGIIINSLVTEYGVAHVVLEADHNGGETDDIQITSLSMQQDANTTVGIDCIYSGYHKFPAVHCWDWSVAVPSIRTSADWESSGTYARGNFSGQITNQAPFCDIQDKSFDGVINVGIGQSYANVTQAMAALALAVTDDVPSTTRPYTIHLHSNTTEPSAAGVVWGDWISLDGHGYTITSSFAGDYNWYLNAKSNLHMNDVNFVCSAAGGVMQLWGTSCPTFNRVSFSCPTGTSIHMTNSGTNPIFNDCVIDSYFVDSSCAPVFNNGATTKIVKKIDHSEITDDSGASGHAHFSNTIPAGSIIRSVKFDYTEAFDSDNTSTLTIQVGAPPAGDADAYNKTASGENAHNTTTDVYWGESDCQEPVVSAATIPYVTFTEDSDITQLISGAAAQGTIIITIAYMKA